MLTVREERPEDLPFIRIINERAFGGPAEADLVDRLRERGKLLVSLVALHENVLIGHIAFSPVRIDLLPHAAAGAGLGPMAVLPERQKRGAGSLLIHRGLEACRRLGLPWIVVLGHPAYYPRFGFLPASGFGIRCPYEAPDEAFMALELGGRFPRGTGGIARYEPEFDAV